MSYVIPCYLYSVLINCVKYFALFALLILVACSSERLVIQAVEGDGIVQINQPIQFQLNKVPQLGSASAIAEQLVIFEPEVTGYFELEGSILTFFPDSLLHPERNYSAVLNSTAWQHLGLKVKDEEVQFSTPLLDLIQAEPYWSLLPESGEVAVFCKLYFNHAISPERLTQFVAVSSSKQYVKYHLITQQKTDVHTIAVTATSKAKKEGGNLLVSLKEGAASTEGGLMTREEKSIAISISAIPDMHITYGAASSSLNGGNIQLFTTQQAKEEGLMEYIQLTLLKDENGNTVNRSVTDYRAVVYDNYIELATSLASGSLIGVKVSKGLEGSLGGILNADFEAEYEIGDLEPSLAISGESSFQLGSKGARNLLLRSVNIPTVEVTIYQIYANNAVHFSHAHLQEYNNYQLYSYLDIEQYGRELKQYSINLPSARNAISQHIVNLDSLISLEKNGFYIVQARNGERRYQAATQLVQLSDIGLISKVGKNEIDIWANSIATTENLEGVTVEVRSYSNQVVAKGTTNNAGYVKLSYNSSDQS